MRKSSKFIVIAGALAALAVPSVASANVAYDDVGVGTVDKGDVMTKFGRNESKFQNVYAKTVKFTNKLVTVKDTSWTCSDGSTQHHYFTTTSIRPVDATQVRNEAANKVISWTLDGLSKTDFGTTTGVGSDGQRFPSYACPGGSYFTGLNVAQTHSTTVEVSSNGVSFDLPNTPVEAPAEPAPTV
jgi:hypothetical protein